MNSIYNNRFGYKLLLVLNIGLFLIALFFQFLTGEFQSFDLEFLSLTGVFSSRLIMDGDIWLLVTSNFVHYDPIHFALNMYAFYTLSKLVIHFYSEKKLFITYMIGALTASLFTLCYAQAVGEVVNSLGASGAIFALLGLLVSGSIKKNRYGADLPIDVKAFYPTLIIAVVISLLPQINAWAHVGGFLAGFILGYILKPDLLQVMHEDEEHRIEILHRILSGILILALIGFTVNFINILLFADL